MFTYQIFGTHKSRKGTGFPQLTNVSNLQTEPGQVSCLCACDFHRAVHPCRHVCTYKYFPIMFFFRFLVSSGPTERNVIVLSHHIIVSRLGPKRSPTRTYLPPKWEGGPQSRNPYRDESRVKVLPSWGSYPPYFPERVK